MRLVPFKNELVLDHPCDKGKNRVTKKSMFLLLFFVIFLWRIRKKLYLCIKISIY